MDTKELIKQVNEAKQKDWQNSDLCKISEEMLEKISEHFENCEECRKLFDSQDYPSENLKDFERDYLINTELSDWICGEEE